MTGELFQPGEPIGLEDQYSIGSYETAAHFDWLGYEVRHAPSGQAGQQDGSRDAVGILRDQSGRNTAADAASGTVSVHFARAGIHHAEVALAVDDLTGQ